MGDHNAHRQQHADGLAKLYNNVSHHHHHYHDDHHTRASRFCISEPRNRETVDVIDFRRGTQ
jgi:hypothetical protein